jgi:hypothetical protein
MVGFGQPMVDAMRLADSVKDMLKGIVIALVIGELDAIIGEHRVDFGGHGGHQVL